MVGLTTLETRRLWADMIEVDKIVRSFEKTDEVKFYKEGYKGGTRGHDWNFF